MPYLQLYYHVVWATKHRKPLITPKIETKTHEFLRAKAIGLGGTVYALNGIVDHIHMVVSVPPKLAVATFVGQVKGVASSKINKLRLTEEPFAWQEEYGAFTFDRKRLQNFVAYVQNQKQHHSQNTAIAALERDIEADAHIHEQSEIYALEEADWRNEMIQI